jgi:hypothetical protein
VGGGVSPPPPLSIAGSVTICAKTTVHNISRFLHVRRDPPENNPFRPFPRVKKQAKTPGAVHSDKYTLRRDNV